MSKFLIKQAIFLPVTYFGMIILSGLFAENYSHLGQHASELGINQNGTAVSLFQTGIVMTSFSLFGLALGIILNFRKRLPIFATLIFFFGITFIFGAIYPIGSPWHGFYGIGLFIMMTPFIFLYESKELFNNRVLKHLSIFAGFFMFLYLWSMVARLDPIDFRGLTQRIFGVVLFGWLSYISNNLNKHLTNNFITDKK